jgi:hypothetical protein
MIRKPAYKPPRDRKCRLRSCRKPFRQYRLGQEVCSWQCGLALKRERDAKRVRREKINSKRETKVALEKFKTRPQLTKEAQHAFNAFIRDRDEGLPCISCYDYPTGVGDLQGGQWDCGHYRTVGAAPELRFDEQNAHKQCKSCNSGVIRNGRRVIVAHDPERHATVRAKYRVGLIARIGISAVERLEGPHEPKKYLAEDLIGIRDLYRKKLRALKRLRREGIA